MLVVSLTLVFVLYYVAMSLACGEGACRLAGDAQGPDDPRRRLAWFLLGTGFAPFAIGLLQTTFLILFAGLPYSWLGVFHGLVAVALLAWCRKGLGETWRAAAAYAAAVAPASRRVGAACVAGALAVLVYFTAQYAIRPIWHGDTLTYGVESKALMDHRSYTSRLKVTPQPGPDTNYIRFNDHPITYIGYLNAAMAFSPDRTQDLAFRAALELQNLSLAVVVLGLGLRAGGFAAVFSLCLLLFAQYFGMLMSMGSRSAFNLIPMLQALGFLRARPRGEAKAVADAVLPFLALLFLWNSHSSSLMVAPLLFAAMLAVTPGVRPRLALTGAFALAILLGANHLIVSKLETGELLGNEFRSANFVTITKPDIWTPPPAPDPGLALLPERLAHQYKEDGPLVPLTFVALALTGWAALRRRRLARPLVAAALLLLVYEAIILGFFDFLSRHLSMGHYTVPRFRFSIYPLTAFVLAGGVCANLRESARRARACNVLAVLLLVSGAAMAIGHWWGPRTDIQVVRQANILQLLENADSCWWRVDNALTDAGAPADALILTDSPVIPWYYTDRNVMCIQDTRLYDAQRTTDPETARRALNDFGVEWMVLSKAKYLSGTAMGVVVEQDFEKAGDCRYDEYFRRKAAAR